jgi:hypothetical protein
MKLGHHYTFETKILSKQGTVFCDSHEIIFIDYLQKGKTISGAYYTSSLLMTKAKLVGK